MRLEIYVASDCLTCDYAYEVAAAARQIAGIEVAVIDLDQSTQDLPPNVVAVPTYLLNGRVISLGNPRLEPFLADLRRRVAERVEEQIP